MVIEHLGALHERIVEAESAGQAAVIGGSDDLRVRYGELKAEIGGELKAVRALASPSSPTAIFVDTLDRRIYRRFAQLDAALHLRSRPAESLPPDIAAIERVAMARSAEVGLMESRAIRDVVSQVQRNHRKALDQERSAHAADMARRRGFFATGALTSAVLQAIGAAVLLTLRRVQLHTTQPAVPQQPKPVQQVIGSRRSTVHSAWSRPPCARTAAGTASA